MKEYSFEIIWTSCQINITQPCSPVFLKEARPTLSDQSVKSIICDQTQSPEALRWKERHEL